MFEKVKPEEVGVSSENIKRYIEILEKHQLSTHDVIMVRHNKVFYEAYWQPFHKDFLHRMYSVTKSFVSLAVGCLVQEGRIDLDAPVSRYLSSNVYRSSFDSVKNQTIRDMLMMSTGRGSHAMSWFAAKPSDRLQYYFDSASEQYGEISRLPGTIFEYDSSGSFVLGCIVENITGKPFLDYLREKCLNRIGFSKEAVCLKCPGGHSWGDSALLCRPMDLARVVNFVMHGGSWDGEQLMDASYIREATSNLTCTDETGNHDTDTYGYGYLIWRTRNNSFYFNGMGCQFGIAVPDKDMVFVINADNQGSKVSSTIIDRFFEEIAENITAEQLPDNPEAYTDLMKYTKSLKLYALTGSVSENISDKINGKEFSMQTNAMGITRMTFNFNAGGGTLKYTNAQGDKILHFGINANVFGLFPQEGYADEVGTVFAPEHYYKCAVSAAWTHKDKLSLLVQVIDKYFGRMYMRAGFTADGKLAVSMFKVAEDFMQEYQGYAKGELLQATKASLKNDAANS